MTSTLIQPTDAELLTAWTERRCELSAELAAARQVLEERRTALVDGSASAADVDATSVRADTLAGAIQALDARISIAEDRERARQAAEARADRVEQLAGLARAAAAATSAFEAARAEGVRAMQAAIKTMQVAHEERLRLRHEFLMLGDEEQPGFRELPPQGRAGAEGERREAALALLAEVQRLADLSAIAPHWRYLSERVHGVPSTALDSLGLPAVGADHGEVGDALDRAAGLVQVVRFH